MLRTMKNKVATCLLGLGLAATLVGCGDGSGGTAATEGDLVGKWNFTRSVGEGYTRVLDGDGEEIFRFNLDMDTTYPANKHYIEFAANKTYTANFPESEDTEEALGKRAALLPAEETGTWSVSGGKLTTVSSDGITSVLSASIDGSDATFKLTVDETETDPESGNTFDADFEITYYAKK